jgi:hypothetical protein
MPEVEEYGSLTEFSLLAGGSAIGLLLPLLGSFPIGRRFSCSNQIAGSSFPSSPNSPMLDTETPEGA